MSYLRKRARVMRANARSLGNPDVGNPDRYRRPVRRGIGDDADNNIMLAQQQYCSDQDNWNGSLVCRGMFPDGPPAAPASQTAQCLAAANTQTAAFDAKTLDIAKNWNPLPTYDSGQIRAIVGVVMSMIREAQSTIDKARTQPNASQDQLQQASDDLINKGKQAVDYTLAANQADAAGAGAAVAAPNIKDWVTHSMTAASSAMNTAYVVSCQTPWWVGSLVAFQTAFDTVWGIVKSIVGTVVAVGGKVIAAVEGGLDLVAWIEKYGPIAAVGLAALWIATRDRTKKIGIFGL